MNLSNLSNQISTQIGDVIGQTVEPIIDWHLALDKQGTFYKTFICDLLSEFTKKSPASLARQISEKITEHFNVKLLSDNQGYLYLNTSDLLDLEISLQVNSVVVYIQPPENKEPGLLYVKMLTLVAIQLELLRQEGKETRIYIPAYQADGIKFLNAQAFYGKNGFAKLFKLMIHMASKSNASDLDNFRESLGETSNIDSVVTWLTPELLSLPNIAKSIHLIREKLPFSVHVNSESLRLENVDSDFNSEGFLKAFELYGFNLLLYIAELPNLIDLDLETPELKNWLNLDYLLETLSKRLEMEASKGEEPAQNLIEEKLLRINFIYENMDLAQKRAAYFGDCSGFLSALKEVLVSIHTLINLGEINRLRAIKISTSFPQKFSSIIKGFNSLSP